MSDDRDRVTALAELGRKVALGGMEVDDFYEAHSALFQGGLWAIRRLLEALDTIDKLEGEKEKLETLVLCVDSELAQAGLVIPRELGMYGILTKAARRIRQRLIHEGDYLGRPPIEAPFRVRGASNE